MEYFSRVNRSEVSLLRKERPGYFGPAPVELGSKRGADQMESADVLYCRFGGRDTDSLLYVTAMEVGRQVFSLGSCLPRNDSCGILACEGRPRGRRNAPGRRNHRGAIP
jgi:hypothetical protein